MSVTRFGDGDTTGVCSGVPVGAVVGGAAASAVAGEDGRVRTDALIEPVSDLIREVTEAEILTRFGRLGADDVAEKPGAEAVTVADRAAEEAIFRGLAEIVPSALLVGEESVAADPSLLDAARTAPLVAVVDPIDGTSSFIAGSSDFAVMIALVAEGRTVASWIHQPVHDRLYTATDGGGAAVNGVPLAPLAPSARPPHLDGVVRTWRLGPVIGPRVRDRARTLGSTGEDGGAAGIDYPRLAEGELDYLFWWRTRIWDHAPGALLVSEVGGRVSRLDGTPYAPFDESDGLIVAADPSIVERIGATLDPDGALRS